MALRLDPRSNGLITSGANSVVRIFRLTGDMEMALRISEYDENELRMTNFMGAIGIGPLCYCYSRFNDTMQILLEALKQNLETYLSDPGAVDTNVGIDVLSLVASTGDSGIVTLDIKPKNMVIGLDKQVRIIDWDQRFTMRASDVFVSLPGKLNDQIIRAFLSVVMLGILFLHVEKLYDQTPTSRRCGELHTVLQAALSNSSVDLDKMKTMLSPRFVYVTTEVLRHYSNTNVFYTKIRDINGFFSYLRSFRIQSSGVPMFDGVQYTDEQSSACCTSSRRRIFTKSLCDTFGMSGYVTIDDANFQLPPMESGVIGKDITSERLKEYVARYAVPFNVKDGYLRPASTKDSIALQQQLAGFRPATGPLRRTLSPGALITPALALRYNGDIGREAPGDTRESMQDTLNEATSSSSSPIERESSPTGPASSPTGLASSQT
jgi:hypothetical protein